MIGGKAVLRIPREGISLPSLDKMLVISALEHNHWNQTRAASFLGISRNALIYRMQKYELGPHKDPSAEEEPEEVTNTNSISITIGDT